jgi:hypothetical protein
MMAEKIPRNIMLFGLFGALLLLGCDNGNEAVIPSGDVAKKCYEVAFSAASAMQRSGYKWEIWSAPCPGEWHTECRAKVNGQWLWVRDGWFGWWLEFSEEPVCEMDLDDPNAQVWTDLVSYGHMVDFWSTR